MSSAAYRGLVTVGDLQADVVEHGNHLLQPR
jgi:hypothetical protein